MSQITPMDAGSRAFLTFSQTQSLSQAGDLVKGCLSKVTQWIPSISLSKRDIAPVATVEREQFNVIICQVCVDASSQDIDENVFAELVKKVYQAATLEEAIIY